MRSAQYVTPERVYEVANRLANQGVPLVEITNTRIRRELGGGSMEDIQPLLREWKELQQNDLGIELPEEVKLDIRAFGQTIWNKASKIAIEKANDRFKEYHAVRRERDELYREVENQDKKITRLLALYGELMSLKEDITGHGKELKVYRARQDAEGFMKVADDKVKELDQQLKWIIEQYFDTSRIDVNKPKTMDSDASGS